MALPVLTAEEMKAWEAATWAAGIRETEVIRRVGERLAAAILERTRTGESVVLLAGRGHNGDDTRAVVPFLADREVHLVHGFKPAVAATELALLLRSGRRPALIVDGLFGMGLNRDLEAPWIEFIEAINGCGIPILAVDVPSGLDAATGRPRGAAIRARWTVTVGAPKTGLLESTAWDYVGRLEILDEVGLLVRPSGIPRLHSNRDGEEPDAWKSDLWWTRDADFTGFPPPRPVASHKGDFGHVVIVAGSVGFHGAAVLAARAAAAARPGTVTVMTPPDAYSVVASQLASVMVRPWDPTAALPANTSTVLVGPGLAGRGLNAEHRSCAVQWWREFPGPMVVDASALDWIPKPAPPTGAIRILTPHPGEAGRRLDLSAAAVNAGRPAAVRALADSTAWVVLKGHQTLVGTATGPIWVNSTGNSGLAQGGTGDVLSGFIAGLIAQPGLAADPQRTLRYAVWEHGRAADRLETRGRNWTAVELASEVGR